MAGVGGKRDRKKNKKGKRETSDWKMWGRSGDVKEKEKAINFPQIIT